MLIKECVAVVTGGASGLGEAVVRSLCSLGAMVAIFDVAVERGERLAAEVGAHGLFVPADVTSDESSRAAMERVVAAFGAINVAVNCAGVADRVKSCRKKGRCRWIPTTW